MYSIHQCTKKSEKCIKVYFFSEEHSSTYLYVLRKIGQPESLKTCFAGIACKRSLQNLKWIQSIMYVCMCTNWIEKMKENILNCHWENYIFGFSIIISKGILIFDMQSNTKTDYSMKCSHNIFRF